MPKPGILPTCATLATEPTFRCALMCHESGHPLIAYDTAARQKKAMLAQAATIAQARTAQRRWPRQPWKASVPAGLRGPPTAAAADGLILIREVGHASMLLAFAHSVPCPLSRAVLSAPPGSDEQG
jgi:hypothetical protein